MHRRAFPVWPLAALASILAGACSDASPPAAVDAGVLDASSTPLDGGYGDAGDAGLDAFPDTSLDATIDGALDAMPDGALDATDDDARDANPDHDTATADADSDAAPPDVVGPPFLTCPSPGAAPGDAPAGTCGASTQPVIATSGTYTFSTASAVAGSPLACSYAYPGPRDQSYGLCLGYSRSVDLSVTGAASAVAVEVTPDCSSSLVCAQTSPASWPRLPPGHYSLAVETYQSENVSLAVTLGRPTTIPFAASCAGTAAIMAQDGELTAPWIYQGDGLSSTVGQTDELLPACSGLTTAPPPGSAYGGEAVIPMNLAAPTQVTVSMGGLFGLVQPYAFSIRTQCASSASEVACMNGPNSMITALLPAGPAYVVWTGGSGPTIQLEVPKPPATNTSCAGATVLSPPPSLFSEDRIVTGGSRYYTVTTTGGFQAQLNAQSRPGYGSAQMDVYAACPATGPSLGTTGGGAGIDLSGAPPGTYSIVVSNITLGTQYSIRLQ
jgi:hypothetical protein